MNETRQRERMSLGLRVIIGLAILTFIEFAVAVWLEPGANLILAIIAVIKAWLILDYFMHLMSVWRGSGEEH